MHAILRFSAPVAVAVVMSAGPLAAQPAGDSALIAEAVQILPEDLRADATVVTYDAGHRRAPGAAAGRQLHRVPAARSADGFVRCYHKLLAPRRDLESEAARREEDRRRGLSQAVAAAVKAGTIPATPQGVMSYRGYDKRDRIQNLWVMSLPNAHARIGGRVDRQPARRRPRGRAACRG